MLKGRILFLSSHFECISLIPLNWNSLIWIHQYSTWQTAPSITLVTLLSRLRQALSLGAPIENYEHFSKINNSR